MAIDFQPVKPGIDFQPMDQSQPQQPSIMQTMGALNEMAPWNQARKYTTDLAGQKIAEAAGHAGYPVAGAIAGTAVQMAPDLLAAGTSLEGLSNSPNPVVKGLVNSPRELGPEYMAQNKAIGVSSDPVEFAGKQQFQDPYQYASQLTKPKYVKTGTDLPVVQPGSTTGDPHAVFAYNENLGNGEVPVSKYQVYGDPAHPVFKNGQLVHGSQSTLDQLNQAGVPVVGRTPRSVGQWEPLDIPGPSVEPVANPSGAAFTRPRVQVGIDSNSAQPLPSTTPIKYSNDPGTFINQANQRMTMHGTNLNPQELYDYNAGLNQKMADGSIPKFSASGGPNPLFAQASIAKAKAVDLLNKVAEAKLPNADLPANTIPTRSGLNQAYGIASKQQALTNFIKKYGVRAVEGAAGVGGVGAIYDYFKK